MTIGIGIGTRGVARNPRPQSRYMAGSLAETLTTTDIRPTPATCATLRENAGQLPIKSPNDGWPLGFIAAQLFVLRPLDRGDSLVLRYAACDRLLDGVADIHQHLSVAEKLFLGLLGVGREGTMSRHEDIRVEGCGRL